jgi:hypothetical protein
LCVGVTQANVEERGANLESLEETLGYEVLVNLEPKSISSGVRAKFLN